MGVGRRMRKQGPPPDLGKIASLESKSKPAGFAHSRGTKRKASGEPKVSIAAEGLSGDKPSRLKLDAANTNVNLSSTKAKPSKSQLSAQDDISEMVSSEDDVADLLDGYNTGSDEDELGRDLEKVGNSEGSVEGEGEGLDEDNLLDSGSSVYDSDAEAGVKARFSDDDDSEAEQRLTAANIEGLSRKLDQEQEEVAAGAKLELKEAAIQTNIDGDRLHIFDDDEENPASSKLAPDLQMLRSRITDAVRVLEGFNKLAENGRSRTDYTSQLLKDICLYYGYSPYIAEKLFNLFSPREAFDFFEASETTRPVVIRTNTLRTHRRQLAQALINRGVTLEPIGKWSKVGLQIFDSQVPLGATPEYLAGHYILQAASSFLPVMALAPQENERILDMAAAPGGKTTYMAALMKNTGCIFANDSNKARAKGLIGNVHRLGVKNTIICNYDAKDFPKAIGGFDRVLLDAPCSGTGVIAKDPSVKTNKTEKDFMQLPHLQKQLLLCAIDSVDHTSKTGGYIVYSTCSVSVEENEQVVQYALRKRPNVKLVETGLVFGRDGFVNYMGKSFDPRMKFTKRYYPHAYNVDGFFVSKFKKTGPTSADAKPGGTSTPTADEATTPLHTGDTLSTEESEQDAEFGGFDAQEDHEYIDRARRRQLKKRGIDPRSVNGSRPRKELNGHNDGGD